MNETHDFKEKTQIFVRVRYNHKRGEHICPFTGERFDYRWLTVTNGTDTLNNSERTKFRRAYGRRALANLMILEAAAAPGLGRVDIPNVGVAFFPSLKSIAPVTYYIYT